MNKARAQAGKTRAKKAIQKLMLRRVPKDLGGRAMAQVILAIGGMNML